MPDNKNKTLQFSAPAACSINTPAIDRANLQALQANGWQAETLLDLNTGKSGSGIAKTFKFATIEQTWAFVHKIMEKANKANHHPGLIFSGEYCKVTLITHAANSLTNVDYKLAVKVDEMYAPLLKPLIFPADWNFNQDLNEVTKTFMFSNFTKAVNFGSEVLAIAGDAHKNSIKLELGWGVCKITLNKGFELAKKIEKIDYKPVFAMKHKL